jgi:hypothetical protein
VGCADGAGLSCGAISGRRDERGYLVGVEDLAFEQRGGDGVEGWPVVLELVAGAVGLVFDDAGDLVVDGLGGGVGVVGVAGQVLPRKTGPSGPQAT